MFELEIESRKVVRGDLDKLKMRFPEDWKETLEMCDGDEEEAEHEFIRESYLALPDLFESTVYDDVDFWIKKL